MPPGPAALGPPMRPGPRPPPRPAPPPRPRPRPKSLWNIVLTSFCKSHLSNRAVLRSAPPARSRSTPPDASPRSSRRGRRGASPAGSCRSWGKWAWYSWSALVLPPAPHSSRNDIRKQACFSSSKATCLRSDLSSGWCASAGGGHCGNLPIITVFCLRTSSSCKLKPAPRTQPATVCGAKYRSGTPV